MPTFDARAAAQEATGKYKPFQFVGMDGETYQLPHPLTMLESEADRFNTDPKGYLADDHPDVAAAIDQMPVSVSHQLLEAWMAEQGEAGKSPEGSSPTRPAVKPSRRTSPRKASTSRG